MVRLRLPSIERIPGGAPLASLSRRVRTLIVSGVLFLVLFLLAVTMPVPYVVLSPGPTYNTLGKADRGQQIIAIDGTKQYQRSGHLNLTTVNVGGTSITAFQAIAGWLAGNQVVVPSSAVYPPGQSQKQTDQQNTQQFIQSQDSAITAALCQLGYPRGAGITALSAGSPSKGKLKATDVIVGVDGKPVTSQQTLLTALESSRAGDTVRVTVKRSGRTLEQSVTLQAPAAGRKNPRLGVLVSNICYAPFKINLALGNEIGGPSAGMMFALGIIDKVGPTDLTKGRFIAGTGTIDPQGDVGPIGGIALKMIAARAKGATVFLAPAGNCDDVRGATPSGLKVVRVTSLRGAVADLLKIQKGQTVPGC